MKKGEFMENVDKTEWDIQGTELKRYLGRSEEIVIPHGVQFIDKYAFNDYRRYGYPIKKLTIPGTVEVIPPRFFKNLPIEELVLGEGVIHIGELAFCNSKIKKLTLPSTTKCIQKFAFSDCDLTELVLNEGIEEIGSSAFYANPLTKIVFPKTLTKINLDAFYSPGKVTTSDIVCHSSHIDDNIHCSVNKTTCNLLVIVDQDFNYMEVYNFIQDIKEKRLSVSVKKITFIGYKNAFNLFILRSLARSAGIEIEMIKKMDENLKGRITKSQDQSMEKEEPFFHSGDKEIDDLVNGIKEKSDILGENLRQDILSQVKHLIEQYQKDLEELRPRLDIENQAMVTLKNAQTPRALRLGLISELQKINMNFIDLDHNIYLKEKIEKYKEMLEDDSTTQKKEQVESTEDKIQEMKYYASVLGLSHIHSEILSILIEIENSLLVSSQNSLVFSGSITTPEQELTRRVDQLYQRLRDAYIFYQSLRGENNTSLGNDMKDLNTIINFLDIESKKDYQERLDDIKNKYMEEVKDLKIDSDSELEVRKELVPVLEDLSELVPDMKEKKGILDDISEAKRIIAGESENILGAITSTTKDIMSLLADDTLDKKTKKTVKKSLLQILDNSYDQIINHTFQMEEKRNSVVENLNWSSKATLKILSEMHGIETFIEKSIDYNQEVGDFTSGFGKGA